MILSCLHKKYFLHDNTGWVPLYTHLHLKLQGLAQSVERLTEEQEIAGSIVLILILNLHNKHVCVGNMITIESIFIFVWSLYLRRRRGAHFPVVGFEHAKIEQKET